MSARALSHVVTRPKVFWLALIGVVLILGRVSLLFGGIFIAMAVWKASKLLADDQLDDLLRLRADKGRHGIKRLLYDGERAEIFALDRYAMSLIALGADPALAQDTMDEAWDIIAQAGAHDAAQRLRLFRESLPALSARHAGSPNGLADRINHELDILHATRKEVESLG